MVHDDYKEMIPARALSALDAAEARGLNEHLDNCSECQRELAEWETTAATLAVAADPAEPSPGVRERILNQIHNESSTAQVIPFKSTSRNIWSSFGSLGAIAAVVLFAVLLIGLAVQWRQNRVMEEKLAYANEFLELVTTPGARVTELTGTDVSAGATAKLVYDKSGHAMLMADKLPTVPQGKAYQLWFIVGKNPPMPGKTFVPDSEGKGMLKDQVPGAALNSAIFAITMEPAEGVAAPTGPIYLRSYQLISQKLVNSQLMDKGKRQQQPPPIDNSVSDSTGQYDLRFVLWRQFCARYNIPVDTLPSQLDEDQKERWEEMKAQRLK